MDDWNEKVKAAHDMVSALCLPRGSKGSREWIMSIPARPDDDPDLVITSGLRAAEKEIKALADEVDELRKAGLGFRDRCKAVSLEYTKVCTENDRLTAELARVKAKSLRWVEDGESCELDYVQPKYFILWEGYVCVPDKLRWELVRITDNHRYDVAEECKAGHKFTVVRLEHWERDGGAGPVEVLPGDD